MTMIEVSRKLQTVPSHFQYKYMEINSVRQKKKKMFQNMTDKLTILFNKTYV